MFLYFTNTTLNLQIRLQYKDIKLLLFTNDNEIVKKETPTLIFLLQHRCNQNEENLYRFCLVFAIPPKELSICHKL